MPDEYLFSIYSIKDGVIRDKGVVTKNGRRYYLEWLGYGIKRRILKKSVERLSKSEIVSSDV